MLAPKICELCNVKLDVISNWVTKEHSWAHFGNGDEMLHAIKVHGGKYERYPLTQDEEREFLKSYSGQ